MQSRGRVVTAELHPSEEITAAHVAAAFSDKIEADMPLPIKAFQFHGGSATNADVEAACQ